MGGGREAAGVPLTDPLTTRQGGTAASLTQQRVCPGGRFFLG